MEISYKIGHQVLQKGTVIKSPSGTNEWVVIGYDDKGKVILACISKYMTKSDIDLSDWHKIR